MIAVCVLWGTWTGALKQALALALVVVAFVVATLLAPRFTDTAGQVTGLAPAEAEAVAWAIIGFGALVLGSALLALARPLVERVGVGGAAGRLGGALLGGAVGCVVIIVVAYATLGWPAAEDDDVVPLSRPSAPEDGDAERGWRASLQEARVAEGVRRGGAWIRGAADLPRWVVDRMEAVDRTLSSD